MIAPIYGWGILATTEKYMGESDKLIEWGWVKILK
jgi:hypothetical protein